MDKLMKIFFVSIAMVVLVLIVYVLNAAIKNDYDHIIPIEKKCTDTASDFNLETELNKIDLIEIKKTFPYDTFFKHGNYCTAGAVQNILDILNKVNPDEDKSNRGVLIYALTEKLQNKIAHRFETFNPDSLILILQWIDDFKIYENIDKKNSALYGVVHDHWMVFISNQLGKHYEREPSIRFSFKFKYLQSTCQSKKYAPAVGKSNLEKVVEYLLNEEYDYLFNRFWNSTGLFVKSLMILLFCFFTYMLYCTFQYSFKN